MKITIAGKQLALTEAMEKYAEKKLGGLEKFFDRIETEKLPLEFDFRVVGDLSDPKFDLFSEFYNQLERKMKSILAASQEVINREVIEKAEELKNQ